jgi:hypothetical protein
MDYSGCRRNYIAERGLWQGVSDRQIFLSNCAKLLRAELHSKTIQYYSAIVRSAVAEAVIFEPEVGVWSTTEPWGH